MDKLTDTDMLRLQLGQERVARLQAEQRATAQELQVAQKDLQTFVSQLSAQYQLQPEDRVNPLTGEIIRKE